MSRFIARWRALSLAGAVLAVLFFASPSYAQGRLQGKVVDKDDKPVEAARITITSDTGRKFELKTDKNGEYFQIGVPRGRYVIIAEKETLGKMASEVQVRSGQTGVANFKIVPGLAGLTDEQLKKNSALQKLLDEAIAAGKADDHQTAIAKYSEVAAGLPTCADCYYNIGLSYSALKNYAEAETAFRKAIEIQADHAGSYSGLANVYNAQKKFDLASQASAKATELTGSTAGGGNADSLYNQGVIAWNAGKAEEAKAQFEAAIKADPNHALSHFQLGMALINAGRLPEAKAEFEAYLRLDPNGPSVAQAKAMLAAIPQ